MSDAAILDPIRSSLRPAKGRGVVVAVSGGGDSVGLLRGIHGVRDELGLRLYVAHLDHGDRGEGALRDAAFVADLAASLGLPSDEGRWAPSRANHFEADARRARYDWLVEVARRREAAFVAVGHTRDDQAETVLHRILRGTGLRGLAGMPESRDLGGGVTLIRPVLDVSRAALRAYLAAIGQGFCEDETNDDLRRTRNRIRRDLLPRLAAEYNPRVDEALARLGRIARGAERMIDERSRAATSSASETALVFRLDVLEALDVAARAEAIRLAWRRAGWPERAMDARRWTILARAVDRADSRFTTAYGIDVRTAEGTLRLSRGGPGGDDPAREVPLAIPGEACWGGVRVFAGLDPEAVAEEAVDLDRIAEGPLGLIVRAPRDGDRFDPLGLGGGTQALNDFFRGRGVAKEDRAGVPLVVDARGIVWVVGHRIAHRVRLAEGTRRRLFLRATVGGPPVGCD